MGCWGLNSWHHVSGQTMLRRNHLLNDQPKFCYQSLPLHPTPAINFHWVPLSLRSLPVLCSSWWTSTHTARTKIHGCVNHRILEEWLFKMHIATMRIKTFDFYSMKSLCKKKRCKLLYMYVQDQFIFMGEWNTQLRLRSHNTSCWACILCLLAWVWSVCKDPSIYMPDHPYNRFGPTRVHSDLSLSFNHFPNSMSKDARSEKQMGFVFIWMEHSGS